MRRQPSFVKTGLKTKRYDFTLTNAVVTKAADGAGDECVIEGYANTSTKDRVGDVVLPEAFAKTLPVFLKNPILLANHDWNDPCGVVLEAKITEQGLWIKARISDTRPDIKTLIREGCLRTFSIGYNEVTANYDEATKTKYIKELELLEISIVTVPANTEAMFTQATAKVEEPAEPVSEGKAASPIKTAAELKSFIEQVKEAVGFDLNTKQVLAVCDYFNDEEDEMKQKELIELLRSGKKSAEAPAAAAAAPADAGKADGAAAPAEQGPDLLKEIMAKLDAIAQGVAQCLEGLKEDSSESESEESSDDAEKPAEGEGAPAADAGKADDAEKELTEEEVEKELAAIESEIAELEDAENA